MADIFDTAEYILMQAGEMSPMKLQRLCYYSQAWSLAWDRLPLFPEDFQAWKTGPVCPELFYKTRGKYPVTAENMTGSTGSLTENQKDTVKRVLTHYGNHDAWWLNQLACMEKPWTAAKRKVPEGTDCCSIIAKKSIAAYYGRL